MDELPRNEIDSLEQAVDDVLTNLGNPTKLSQSVWSYSFLVKQARRGTTLPTYEAIKLVFTEALEKLESMNPEFGEILRKRFWDGVSVRAYALAKFLPESTFYSQQRDAKKQFNFILIESEKALRQQLPTLLRSETESSLPVQPAVRGGSPIQRRTGSYISRAIKLVNSLNLKRHFTFVLFTLLVVPALLFVFSQFELYQPTRLATATCREASIIPDQSQPFIGSQGVVSFTTQNTANGLVNNHVRAVAVDSTGLWIGYVATEDNPVAGVGHFDSRNWQKFALENLNTSINAIAVDPSERVWVATQQHGITMFDGERGASFTTNNGLPDDRSYGFAFSPDGNTLAATWGGIGEFNGQSWILKYSAQNRNLFANDVHAIAFDAEGNLWTGYIGNGVSQRRVENGELITYSNQDGLGGMHVRGIAIQETSDGLESIVWVASEDGGLSRFEEGVWTAYDCSDGLPSINVQGVAVDKYNRVWAATAAGVVYYENDEWITYNTLDTSSIAFGYPCENCPFDDDNIFTGTKNYGVTRSRLPHLNNFSTIDVIEVCFITSQPLRICPPLNNYGEVVEATFPTPLTPDERVQFDITIVPREPYELSQQRGDFLANMEENEEKRFGAHLLIAVSESSTDDTNAPLMIGSNERFTFADYNKPFVAPTPSANQSSDQTFTSTWRVWAHGRYTGPYIRINFTVKP